MKLEDEIVNALSRIVKEQPKNIFEGFRIFMECISKEHIKSVSLKGTKSIQTGKDNG